MPKGKLTIKGNFDNFKNAAALADVKLIDAAKFGALTKVEIEYKTPQQIRDLSEYEQELNVKS